MMRPISQPSISIVTACYNSIPFLDRIYQSLNSQTYRRFEWICVDDCSSDDTICRLVGLEAPGDLGMQVFQLPQNTGGGVALAVGIQRATGDIVVLLDHDDELFPFALDEIVRNWPKVAENPALSGVFHRASNPLDKSLIGGELRPGSVFSSSEMANRADVTDGTFAFKADLIRRYATVKFMEAIGLGGALLFGMTAKYPFVIADGPPIRFYHRDNPDSQTLNEKLSRKTVHSYAKMIDAADRYFLLRPVRWLRHIGTMLRYSKVVHGRWFAALESIDRLAIRLLVISLWPLGWLASKQLKNAPTVLNFAYFDPQTEPLLMNLWRPSDPDALPTNS